MKQYPWCGNEEFMFLYHITEQPNCGKWTVFCQQNCLEIHCLSALHLESSNCIGWLQETLRFNVTPFGTNFTTVLLSLLRCMFLMFFFLADFNLENKSPKNLEKVIKALFRTDSPPDRANQIFWKKAIFYMKTLKMLNNSFRQWIFRRSISEQHVNGSDIRSDSVVNSLSQG